MQCYFKLGCNRPPFKDIGGAKVKEPNTILKVSKLSFEMPSKMTTFAKLM